MTTHIKIEAEDAGLGITPIYTRRYAAGGEVCIDDPTMITLLDAWSDGATTRSWDTISASDDEAHIVTAHSNEYGIHIGHMRPAGESDRDIPLWSLDSLPFKTTVTPLTIDQSHALLEEGGMFEAHLGTTTHVSDGTDGSVHFASDDDYVEVHVGWSPLTPDYKLIQIDVTGPVRIVLNENDIYDGDTEGHKI